MDLGKKVYRSTAIWTVKIMALVIIVVLFINLYFQTFNDPEFATFENRGLKEFFMFHVKYPYDLLSYIFFILIPCIYYGFIRGLSFYENGIFINRGAPFYNTSIKYSDISRYKIIHSKLLMAIKLKNSSKEVFFTIKSVDRAISIFDQQGIPGDLKSKMQLPVNMHNKVMVLIISVGIAVAIGQTSLWLSRFLFR